MLLFILIVSLTGAWSVLAFIGVQRGLEGRVIVFQNWSDCALTAFMVSLLVIDLITGTWPADETRIVRILTLVVALPWLLMTSATNSRARDLLSVVPAKLTLVLLAGISSFLALTYAVEALSSKTEPQSRLRSVASAVFAAGLALGLFGAIRRLVANSTSAHIGRITSFVSS
jgi:hypothetical protein